jgi:hypothetical protein
LSHRSFFLSVIYLYPRPLIRSSHVSDLVSRLFITDREDTATTLSNPPPDPNLNPHPKFKLWTPNNYADDGEDGDSDSNDDSDAEGMEGRGRTGDKERVISFPTFLSKRACPGCTASTVWLLEYLSCSSRFFSSSFAFLTLSALTFLLMTSRTFRATPQDPMPLRRHLLFISSLAPTQCKTLAHFRYVEALAGRGVVSPPRVGSCAPWLTFSRSNCILDQRLRLRSCRCTSR